MSLEVSFRNMHPYVLGLLPQVDGDQKLLFPTAGVDLIEFTPDGSPPITSLSACLFPSKRQLVLIHALQCSPVGSA